MNEGLKLPDLEGANLVPDLLAEPTTAEDFAALWNTASPADRARMFAEIARDREGAHRCLVGKCDAATGDTGPVAPVTRATSYVLVARDFDDARTHQTPGCRSVVTPLSPNRARGIRVAEIHVTPGALALPHTLLTLILEDVAPCIATATDERPRIRILENTTLHAAPTGDDTTTPCCNEHPTDLPTTDRMTRIRRLVTCGPTPTAYALAEGAES